MKNNWETKKLGEVLEYEQPTQYIVSSTNYKEDYKTPVLTAGKSFVLGKTKEKNGIFPAKDLPVIIFDDFTTATKFVDFPFKVKSSAMKILHPVKNVSDAKFLFYLMQNINFDHAGIHKRYWISEYSKIEILLPPLMQQKRIARTLDEAFQKVTKARAAVEKNLQNSQELFESYLQKIFANLGDGWESIDFERSTDKVVYTTKIQRKKFLESGKFPVVSQEKDLINGYWDVKEDVFKIKRPVVIFGDHTQIIKYIDFNFVLGADGVKILQPKEFLFPRFFYYWLKSINLKKLGYARHYRLLREKQILYPKSISEQKSIAHKLDALSVDTNKLENNYERKLVDLAEFKKSILKMAVTNLL